MSLNITGENNDQSSLSKDDFQQTLESMSESRFIVDVSFLGLLLRGYRKKLSDNSKDSEDESNHWLQISHEINQVFNLIKHRNFRQCQEDKNYYLFCSNSDDFKVDINSDTSII